MTTKRYFDLYLNSGVTFATIIKVNQYDRTEEWVFTLYNEDGTVYIPEDGAIVGIKTDGHVVIRSATIDDQGRVVVKESLQMTAAAGDSTYELIIDHGMHGTANFIVRSEPQPATDEDLSDADISLIEEAIATAMQAEAVIKQYSDSAEASATTATEQAGIATVQASTATSAAEAASDSASIATTNAATASQQATIATTQAEIATAAAETVTDIVDQATEQAEIAAAKAVEAGEYADEAHHWADVAEEVTGVTPITNEEIDELMEDML